jgi:Ca-activated chloride channel homolog
MSTLRPDTMHPRNKLILFVAILCLMCVPAAWSEAAPQATQPSAAQTPQEQAAAEAEMEEPLKPDDLVVPSNAALTAVTSPPVTITASNTPATASHAPNQPSDTVQVQGREVQQKGKSGIFTMRAEVDEVVLHATVVDEHQRLITNLDRNAFSIFEDGQQQPITSFRHEDVPVAVGILVDNSGSMRNKRAAVTQAALNFVKTSNPDDRVFIVNFDTDAYIDQDFTASIPKMREALDRIDSHGGTALYDAVVASSDYIIKQPNIDKKLEKKVLLVVTDGWDNASLQSLEQAVRHVQVDNGPTIYTIGILDEDAKKRGHRALRELAEQTGGVAYFPKDLAEVDTITQEVARDIRNQYTIGFKKNPNDPPGYRAVKVAARADGYKNLTVRTRSGYFQGEEKAAKK